MVAFCILRDAISGSCGPLLHSESLPLDPLHHTSLKAQKDSRKQQDVTSISRSLLPACLKRAFCFRVEPAERASCGQGGRGEGLGTKTEKP